MRSMNGGGEEVISGGQPAGERGTTIRAVKKPTWWTIIGMWMVFFVAQVVLIRLFFGFLSVDWSTKPLITKWGAKGSVYASFFSSFFLGLLMFLKTDRCPRLTNVLLPGVTIAFLITSVGSGVMAAVAVMFSL